MQIGAILKINQQKQPASNTKTTVTVTSTKYFSVDSHQHQHWILDTALALLHGCPGHSIPLQPQLPEGPPQFPTLYLTSLQFTDWLAAYDWQS